MPYRFHVLLPSTPFALKALYRKDSQVKNCTFCFKSINNCHCGLNHNDSQNDIAKSQSIKIILLSVFIIALVLHLANWNNHFFAIILPKVKTLAGVANADDYIKIAKICKDRKKIYCELKSIEKAFLLNSKYKEYLSRAGEIYFKQNKYNEVVRVLGSYFKMGGTDRKARQNLAYSLNVVGKYKDAKIQYSYLIKTDNNDPDFKLAREYVQLLLKNKEYNPAKNVIENYRNRTATAQLFMDQELKLAKAAF